MSTETNIQLRLSESAISQFDGCTSKESRGQLLITMVNEKLDKFQQWARKSLGDDMTKFELAAIRTFLYRELTGELDGEGNIMSLPRVSIEHPASIV